MRLTVLLLLGVLSAAAMADPPWKDNVLAADVGDTINEGESCLAFKGDYVYCICNVNERDRYAVIPYGRSTDGGETWQTTWWRDLTPGISWHSDPIILCDDTGYVHMFVQFSSTLIRHYLSTDNGLTWCDTSDVSLRTSGTDKPWACHYGNDLYVCWQQVSGSPTGVIFARSSDGGRSWTRANIDSRTGITGICASPSGILYVVLRYWSGGSLHVFRSTDRGATWPHKVTLDTQCQYTAGYGDRAPMPAIAAPADSNVFVTLVDQRSGNWDILYSRSTDAGATWTSLATLNDSTAGGQCKGWVSTDPYGRLHIIWYHTPSWPTSSSSRWSVRYQYSDDYGARISPSLRLSDTTFQSPVSFLGEYHIVLADSHRVRCVWADGRGGDLDLYFAEADQASIGIVERPFRVVRMPGVMLYAPAVARAGDLTIDFVMRHAHQVRVAVFDAAGRRLKLVEPGTLPAGVHRLRLDGLTPNQTVFIRLEAGETATAKSTLLP